MSMRDPFLENTLVVSRLVEEWEKHGNLIIAYDFDNTVYDYHNKGYEFPRVIELLRKCKAMGAHLIVFTSKNDDTIHEVSDYLDANDIPYDSINEDAPDILFTGRKLYYNILLDDRAGLYSAYRALSTAVAIREMQLNKKDEEE